MLPVEFVVRVIEESGFFDGAWYSKRYRDVELLGMGPAEHYVRIGTTLLRDPGPDFSTAFYLNTHPDVAQAGVNPLWHYLAHGREEGRAIAASGYHLLPIPRSGPVPLLQADPPEHRPVRLIAFYLPQFHPIPENDAWWGDGFTEWTNVRPAKPQFPRHYQPHVPGELGYYDLRDASVQRRQVELAKLYGLEGFCFYFYWFAGKRLLETPLRNYLGDPGLDLPFCLCWANENWSRRWDGRDHDVLIAQEHSPQDDLAFIAHVAQYMRDPRYIRVDGKPLLLVYRPGLLPDPAATAARWRKWCRDNGLGEIHLAYTQSFESNDPGEYGFDAAVEFPPNNSGVPQITAHARPRAGFQGRIFDWRKLVDRSFHYVRKPYAFYRGICPSWDNTARRGASGTILAHSTPARFTRWAINAFRDAVARFQSPGQRLVFVNAWNEWAEGAHLEPDQRYGYAWLESIRVALACAPEPAEAGAGEPAVAVVVDATSGEDISGVLEQCRALPDSFRLFVVASRIDEEGLRTMLEGYGRDFALRSVPDARMGKKDLLALLPVLQREGFRFVIRVDASGHRDDAAPGPGALAPEFVETAMAAFAADHLLGMLCPREERQDLDSAVAAEVVAIGSRLGLLEEETRDHAVWNGRAYAARIEALAPLAQLAFTDAQFEPGTDEFSPMLAAAIERAQALAPVAAGYRVADADRPFADGASRRVVIVSHDAHPHGAQLLALNMAREYVAMGFHVDMIVLGPGRLLDRFAEVATVHRVDMERDLAIKTLRLLQAIRAAGAQVAIANTTVSGSLVPLLKHCGFSVVSLIHELPGILESYALGPQALAIADHADRIVFPARIVRGGFRAFTGRGLEQGVIRPQGLYLRNPHRTPAERDEVRRAIRAQYGLSPDSRIVLCVGYADHRKGTDLFADACTRLMRGEPKAIAMWVGHADEAVLAEARRAFEQAGFADRFVFTGLVDNPQDYYTAADAYALTSREDPFPSVVMEALDALVPVVSFSGVVGSEELLERGTGILVPAFDTEAMAEALRSLLEDRASAEAMAEKGRDIIESEFGFRHYLFDLMALAGCPIPKVSVVVPNYNYARYIEERLQSVAAQTLPVFELIVLDDASTDDSVEVIREFLADCRVPWRLVVNDGNSGSVFRQWQRGVEMARGEYVWIAEADDLADPELLEAALPAFADPDVVMSYTQSRQMGSEGEILCEHYLDYVADIDRERWTKPYVADGREEISTALFVKNTIPNVSAVVFRREQLLRTLVEHGDEILSYRNAGDWVAYIRVLERGSIAYCPRSLNSHRRHQSSVTIGSFNVKQLREIASVQKETIARHALDNGANSKAEAYVQVLYQQFGLADEDHPRFSDHPGMAAKTA